MSASDYNEIEIKKELEARFLYHDDVDAMDLLLSIIDNNQSYNKLRPKYICSDRIRTSLRRMLHYRDDKEFIISAVLQGIHNDINRMELSLYLDYYTLGYGYKDGVDLLEREVLKRFTPALLATQRKLYHESKDIRIKKLRNQIIGNYREHNSYLYTIKLINNYCDKTMRPKIMHLNTTMNKQLRFYYDSNNIYIHDEVFISKKLLNKIYKRVLSTFTTVMLRTATNAVWYGINDRVLDRYK